jgi:hypothetical protein
MGFGDSVVRAGPVERLLRAQCVMAMVVSHLCYPRADVEEEKPDALLDQSSPPAENHTATYQISTASSG